MSAIYFKRRALPLPFEDSLGRFRLVAGLFTSRKLISWAWSITYPLRCGQNGPGCFEPRYLICLLPSTSFPSPRPSSMLMHYRQYVTYSRKVLPLLASLSVRAQNHVGVPDTPRTEPYATESCPIFTSHHWNFLAYMASLRTSTVCSSF